MGILKIQGIPWICRGRGQSYARQHGTWNSLGGTDFGGHVFWHLSLCYGSLTTKELTASLCRLWKRDWCSLLEYIFWFERFTYFQNLELFFTTIHPFRHKAFIHCVAVTLRETQPWRHKDCAVNNQCSTIWRVVDNSSLLLTAHGVAHLIWAILDKGVAVVDIDITSAMQHVQHETNRYLALLGATERAQDVCSRPDRTLRQASFCGVVMQHVMQLWKGRAHFTNGFW